MDKKPSINAQAPIISVSLTSPPPSPPWLSIRTHEGVFALPVLLERDKEYRKNVWQKVCSKEVTA
jgi:hypothetical protein